MANNGNVIAVIDGEAGSCGKAKVIGEIATDKSIKLSAAVTNCMPNAGHSFVSEKGEKTIFRNIPVSSINEETELFIGPGSAIDMETFSKEYEKVTPFLKDRKIYVHERVPLIEERHIQYEKEHIKSGSTFKGCGAVAMEKAMRDPKLKFFQTYKNAVVCSNNEWTEKLHSHLYGDGYVMLEGAQGCDLDLNHSGNYPYVTSRSISTTQLLSDSGIPADALLGTIMVIRPYPIRINNFTDNNQFFYTGDNGTGLEITWTDVNLGALNGVLTFRGFESREELYRESFHAESILDKGMNYVIAMYEVLTDEYKYMVLGNGEYKKSLTESDIDFKRALEIERLYHKMLGEKTYVSRVIKRINNNGRVFRNSNYEITDLSEETSVTKRERRIFQLDLNKLKNNVRHNNPYGIYLNFAEHLDINLCGLKGDYLSLKKNPNINTNTIEAYIQFLESSLRCENGINPKVLALGTGAKNGERIIRRDLIGRR